jgi:hypothetical protein
MELAMRCRGPPATALSNSSRGVPRAETFLVIVSVCGQRVVVPLCVWGPLSSFLDLRQPITRFAILICGIAGSTAAFAYLLRYSIRPVAVTCFFVAWCAALTRRVRTPSGRGRGEQAAAAGLDLGSQLLRRRSGAWLSDRTARTHLPPRQNAARRVADLRRVLLDRRRGSEDHAGRQRIRRSPRILLRRLVHLWRRRIQRPDLGGRVRARDRARHGQFRRPRVWPSPHVADAGAWPGTLADTMGFYGFARRMAAQGDR